MIDVATLAHADRCPRCRERRVALVDAENGFWLCIPNAAPMALFKTKPGIAIEHDALTDGHAEPFRARRDRYQVEAFDQGDTYG